MRDSAQRLRQLAASADLELLEHLAEVPLDGPPAQEELCPISGLVWPSLARRAILIVAGTLTTKMAGPLIRLWEQMPEPKWCIALGDCTCSGGRYKRSYSTIQGIDRLMPVDVYVPGCPPRPEALLYAFLNLQQLINYRRGHWPERAIGPTIPEGV